MSFARSESSPWLRPGLLRVLASAQVPNYSCLMVKLVSAGIIFAPSNFRTLAWPMSHTESCRAQSKKWLWQSAILQCSTYLCCGVFCLIRLVRTVLWCGVCTVLCCVVCTKYYIMLWCGVVCFMLRCGVYKVLCYVVEWCVWVL